jgi:hypothetical protein
MSAANSSAVVAVGIDGLLVTSPYWLLALLADEWPITGERDAPEEDEDEVTLSLRLAGASCVGVTGNWGNVKGMVLLTSPGVFTSGKAAVNTSGLRAPVSVPRCKVVGSIAMLGSKGSKSRGKLEKSKSTGCGLVSSPDSMFAFAAHKAAEMSDQSG